MNENNDASRNLGRMSHMGHDGSPHLHDSQSGRHEFACRWGAGVRGRGFPLAPAPAMKGGFCDRLAVGQLAQMRQLQLAVVNLLGGIGAP